MSGDSEVRPITVTIFDKDYVVGCKENEREALFASVQFLNKKMIEQRDNGKVIGSERIAVMARCVNRLNSVTSGSASSV